MINLYISYQGSGEINTTRAKFCERTYLIWTNKTPLVFYYKLTGNDQSIPDHVSLITTIISGDPNLVIYGEPSTVKVLTLSRHLYRQKSWEEIHSPEDLIIFHRMRQQWRVETKFRAHLLRKLQQVW